MVDLHVEWARWHLELRRYMYIYGSVYMYGCVSVGFVSRSIVKRPSSKVTITPRNTRNLYRSFTGKLNSWMLVINFHNISIKLFPICPDGEHIITMCTCTCTSPPDNKLYTASVGGRKTSLVLSAALSSGTCKLSLWARLVYNNLTSSVTNRVSGGTFVINCYLVKNSVVSLMYNGMFFTSEAK